jgi:hypothetical protein
MKDMNLNLEFGFDLQPEPLPCLNEPLGEQLLRFDAFGKCTQAIVAGLKPLLILINDQTFTKTSNCWGVDNNSKGTNTNRIVVFRK